MDQSAFRSLLSGPRSAEASGSSSRGSVLGAAAPKRGWGIKPKSGKEYEKRNEDVKPEAPAFAPRAHQKKLNNGKYKDRAEMRRQGVHDEYKAAEQLLADFEKRAADAGDDEDAIEQRRKYLGGDAEHSILVKGLDYSLLAARKAELAKQQEEVADDELDTLLKSGKVKAKPDQQKNQKLEPEVMAKGFRSITAKAEKPKKKKKKKITKEMPVEPAGAKVVELVKAAGRTDKEPAEDIIQKKPVLSPPPSPSPIDDDIFGDVGDYDLDAARGADAGSESGSSSGSVSPKGRSRSRDPRSYSRPRQGEPYSRSRDTSYSSGSYSRSPSSRYRTRSPSPYRHHSPYRSRYRSPSPSRRSPPYRWRRSPSPYGRRSPPSHRYSPARRHRYSRSPSPYRKRRRSRSPRRSPSPYSPRVHRSSIASGQSDSFPAKKGPREASRSLSPMLDPYAMARSPSLSSDEDGPLTGKLQPLASSNIADVKTFLSADASAAKAEEKRLRKAKWRARQGLAPQDGAEAMDKKMNDKQKANRDYVLLMNQMEKGKQPQDKQ